MRANTHTYDDHKVTEREMTKMLITTVLSVLICLVSLVSLTWAWFSDGVTTNPIPITAAYYTVEVQTFDGTNYTSAAGTGTDKEYTIPVNTTKIKLTAGGTATTGFFLIEANGKKFHTNPITLLNGSASTEIPVSGVTTETVTIKIIPAWGGIPTGYETVLPEGPEGGISFAESLTPPPSKSMPKKKAGKEEVVPEDEEEIEEIIEEEIEDIPDEEIIEEEIEIPEEEPEEIPETPSEETPAETPTEETEE